MTTESTDPDVNAIVDAAARFGVELDVQEARQWMLAVSAADREAGFAQDLQAGVFGHRVALIDFDRADLEYFRRLAAHVRLARRPDVESALAIAGSAAQGKVQVFPGDHDFYERVNIKAATLDEARETLQSVVRETALRALECPGVVLVEANFGVYPCAVIERGTPRTGGDSIAWRPQDVVNGYIDVWRTDGAPLRVTWADAQVGQGWTYIGWIVADEAAGRIALASNMMDVTWEAPDGCLTSLDGVIDPVFQEIYLEPDAFPVFMKIAARVDAGAMTAYVNALRWQAFHYTREQPDFCKASKRLYNLFRLADDWEAAAYLRELFDEPGSRLYQVSGLLHAADVALHAGSRVGREIVVKQIDEVIRSVVESAAGRAAAADLVLELVRLRDVVIGREPMAEWEAVLPQVCRRCSDIVNEYFRVRVCALPRIVTFIDALERDHARRAAFPAE